MLICCKFEVLECYIGHMTTYIYIVKEIADALTINDR